MEMHLIKQSSHCLATCRHHFIGKENMMVLYLDFLLFIFFKKKQNYIHSFKSRNYIIQT